MPILACPFLCTLMNKAAWVDAFVLEMIQLGSQSPRLGQWAGRYGLTSEKSFRTRCLGQHAIGDTRPGAFPDTKPADWGA